jgi:TAT-translocated FGD2 family F420-dependent dehydrogenase
MEPTEQPDAGGRISRRRWAALFALCLGGLGSLGAACARTDETPTPAALGGRPGGKPVGFVLSSEQSNTGELVRLAGAAEVAGFGYLWTSDHLQPWQDNQGHADFPWITLGLAGQRTRSATIGTGVTCPTYRHHPSEVAQAFATLAGLSPGRVFLGVGTGEAINELAATGSFGPYQERHDRLVEAITLIRRLWSGERVSFAGRYFRTEQLKLYDVPNPAPPVYVAAGGPRSAALAGQYGDGWILTGGKIDPELRAAFERAARAAGKDPARMPVFVEQFVVVGDQSDSDQVARQWRFTAVPEKDHLVREPNPVTIQQRAEQVPLTGVGPSWIRGVDPRVHIEATQRLLDQGATPFIHAGQSDPDTVIDFYGRHVLPALRT